MKEADEYTLARGRAEAKYRFFVHAGVYVVVMLLLVTINMVNSPSDIWFIWPLIGWGIAVALHGAQVFFRGEKRAVIDALTERELRSSGLNKPGKGPE